MTGGEAQDRPQGGVAPRATARWILNSGPAATSLGGRLFGWLSRRWAMTADVLSWQLTAGQECGSGRVRTGAAA